MARYYEIVIFTAGTEEYANRILDDIDKENNHISHRLYRQHTSLDEVSHYKDLDKVGRDLTKTIIVDNSPHNFKYNKDNGLLIKTWTEDPSDIQLLGLASLLKRIALMNPNDVRPLIKFINSELDKEAIKMLKNPYEQIQLVNN
jgi:CTD small phosphatase-like protein 2